MIRFIAGTVFGSIIGVVMMCLCVAAREADRYDLLLLIIYN